MFKLYEFFNSGNCYKVRLLLTQLRIPFERVEINILRGESRTPEFLSKNPNGRVPVLEIKPNKFLAESNAILFYLSENTRFLPQEVGSDRKYFNGCFLSSTAMNPISLPPDSGFLCWVKPMSIRMLFPKNANRVMLPLPSWKTT